MQRGILAQPGGPGDLHPFHPLAGRDFEFVVHRQNWGEDRELFSLPAGWTDVAAADPFVVIAAGRCPFTADDLLAVVPAPVLAEAWRGGSRQASLVRFLRMCDIEPMGEDLARYVGVLAGKSGHGDIVDVAVAEGAIRRGDAIVTSNVTPIRKVAEAARAELRIESV